MKKVIIALLITVFATTLHYASAQINTTTHDTVVGKHPRCYYTSWYDTCPDLYIDNQPTQCLWSITGDDNNFVLSEYHTAHPIAVKGLAAMVARPEEMAIASGAWSLTDQNLPQYLMLYQRTDTAIVLLNTPLRWDTLSPTLQVLPDVTNEDRRTDTVAHCHLYMVYFKSPIYVDSTFLVGGTNYGSNDIFIPEWNDYYPYYRKIWYTQISLNGYFILQVQCFPTTDFYEPPISDHNPTHPSGHSWGPFFAIADFYDVRTAPADSLMGYTVGDGSYSDLTHVEIRAVPRLGYRFLRWNDGNTDNPRSIFLTQDTSFTAYFTTAEQFEVIVQAGNPYGYVDGGGTFFDGQSTTLTAHDTVPGYRFLRWNDHNTDNPRTVVVTQDTIFTAFFSRQQGIDSPLSPLPAFTLSPNPAHTSVTVTLAAPCGSGCSLSLLDASGHTVLSLPLPAGSSNATLPLRDLPAGPYFVSLSSPQGSSSQKLILQ